VGLFPMMEARALRYCVMETSLCSGSLKPLRGGQRVCW